MAETITAKLCNVVISYDVSMLDVILKQLNSPIFQHNSKNMKNSIIK